MRILMPAALLVMALITAPALAQETTSPDMPPVGAPADESTEAAPDPGPPLAPETPSALETLLQYLPLEEDPPPPQDPPPQDPPPQDPPPQDPPPQDPPPQDAAPPPDLLPEDVLSEDVLPQAPPLPPPPPQASQGEAEDQEADEDVPKPEFTAQETDSDDLDQEVEDRLADIADLSQRIEDQLGDAPSLKQRDGDREENDDDDDDKDNDDDDNGPGRKDSNDRDDDAKQETEQDAESGEVDQSVDVSNTGDFANQCVGIVQAANTGNAQNAPAFLQDSGDADDFEPGGIGIDISPQLVQDCRQIIQQTTVVNQLLGEAGQPRAGQPRAGQPGGRVPGTVVAGLPPRIAGSGFNSAGGSGGGFNVPTRLGQSAIGLSGIGQARIQPLSAPSPGRMLPRTGGPGAVSLLTLGAGALLIAGGLLVRRISR